MVKLDHAKLTVKDWRAARDWYIKHLGLKLEFEAAAGRPNLALPRSMTTRVLHSFSSRSPNAFPPAAVFTISRSATLMQNVASFPLRV